MAVAGAVPVVLLKQGPERDAQQDNDSDDGVDSETGEVPFDYAALEEAQRIAAGGAGATPGADGEETRKRKCRGGDKAAQKRRKRQRREDDMLRAEQAGVVIPSRKSCKVLAAGSQEARHGVGALGAQTVTRDTREAIMDAVQQAEDPKTAAALMRVAKQEARKEKLDEAGNARRLFVTNLPFKMTENELREWLSACGTIREVHLTRDKATSHSLGYAHVLFDKAASVDEAIQRFDQTEKHGRIIRVTTVKKGDRFQFHLPQELKDDICALMREKYEGMNLSTIKDAWQKRHPGQKLDASKWGFKNFSSAVRTIEGVCLESHLEKSLTFLAFFEGSPAHKAFLEAKSTRNLQKSEGTGEKSEDASCQTKDIGGCGERKSEVAGLNADDVQLSTQLKSDDNQNSSVHAQADSADSGAPANSLNSDSSKGACDAEESSKCGGTDEKSEG